MVKAKAFGIVGGCDGARGLWIFQGAQLMGEGLKDLRDMRLIGKLCIQ